MGQLLRALVEIQVRNGTLPAEDDARSFGGRSTGSTCGICAERIARGAPEVEMVWEMADGLHVAMLHPDCHALWSNAARRADRKPWLEN